MGECPVEHWSGQPSEKGEAVSAVIPGDAFDIHLTHRACEWLVHSRGIIDNAYVRPMGLKACVRLEDVKFRLKGELVIYGPNSAVAHEPIMNEAGRPVITPEQLVTDKWACGVADVRAMYLSMVLPRKPGQDLAPYKVKMVPTSDTPTIYTRHESLIHRAGLQRRPEGLWVRAPVMMPTCGACRVALDKALGNACDKTGNYRDISDEGTVVWRKYPPNRFMGEDDAKTKMVKAQQNRRERERLAMKGQEYDE